MLVIPQVYDRKTMVFLQEYRSKLSVTIKNPCKIITGIPQKYNKRTTGLLQVSQVLLQKYDISTTGISQIYDIKYNKNAVVKRPKKQHNTTYLPHNFCVVLLMFSTFNVVKFADDTTVIGLITDNDETAYREEVSTLTKWCQENHLSLNIDKTKELVVDFRRQSREHTPISIDKTPVERVNSFKFLGVHITEDLTWSAHTDAVLKKAHQRLFFLRRLRKFGMSPSILRSFYTCTVESILTGCITAWFGNSTAGNRKALQRVVRTARHIVGGELPSLQDIYTRRCIRKARRIIKDSSHPSHRLLSLLPSGKRLRSIRSRTSRLRDSFFPQAIRLMNSQN